jgi:membrane-associated protease RseP (regulator of RpoE activity)
VRLDRLERQGIVTREADPASARGSMVQLTATGLALFDRVAPVHLANEDRMLAALSGDERLALAGLLRRLLASFETRTTEVAGDLGLTLEPAHLARQRRQAVGLADRVGLLVAAVQPGSAAAQAGIERGDLLTRLDGQPVISSTGLALLLDGLAGRPSATAVIVRGNEESSMEIRLPGPA